MVLMPAVIGSLAGGEERQFGTHDAQLLLPMKVSTQWVVKAALAIGLSLVVALLMPAVLTSAFGMRTIAGPHGLLQPPVVIIVLGFATVSLYVSTLARSGLMALMYSIGAIVGVGYFTARTAPWFNQKSFELIHQLRPGNGPTRSLTSDVFWIAPLIGFVVLVLCLALPNYRYANRSARRVAMHAGVVAACIAAYASLLGVIEALTA
jgi:hypothetical protein